MRRVFVFILFLFGCSRIVWAGPPVLIADEKLQAELKKTAVFEKQEKFEEAQAAYKKISHDYALTAKQLKRVRKRRQDLNITEFFSGKKTPGSFIYTVKEDDTLFDLAKKYNTNMELIRKSNGLKEDKLLKGSKLKILKKSFSIKVDKSENRLYLYFDKKLVKEYSVTTGANNKTPAGEHRIINKVENPTWYFDDKVIPAGNKKNMLGTRWMGFDKPTYGIHGTTEPEEIGQQASLGCVRMLNHDVEELYLLVPLNTAVTITD